MNHEEKIICEAGFLWRFVMVRFEERVNALLKEGWKIDTMNGGIRELGWMRPRLIAFLRRGK